MGFTRSGTESTGRVRGLIKGLACVSACLIAGYAHAQLLGFDKNRGKLKKYPFPSTSEYRKAGWISGGGGTFTFQFVPIEHEVLSSDGSGFRYTFRGLNRPGVTAEIGRYLNFPKFLIFDFVTATFGYKLFRGGQEFDIEGVGPSANTNVQTAHNVFSSHFNSLTVNINNIIRINDFNFVLNSLGANADYMWLNNMRNSNRYPSDLEIMRPEQFVGQLNYRIGWGFKADVDKVILVSLETPVFNFTPQEQNFSELDYFNMPFRSVLIKIQFMLFRYDPNKCPPVNNPQLPAGFRNGYGDN